MLEISLYTTENQSEWDRFVDGAKNGSFMFRRAFMDYHSDRFRDHSFMFRKKGDVVALLPASREGDEVCSHGGLTYGGVLSDERMTQGLMLQLFEVLLGKLRTVGVKKMVYKSCPSFYQTMPADEDLYALFRQGAALWRRDVNSVLRPGPQVRFRKGRSGSVRKASQSGVIVVETQEFDAFWKLLEHTLDSQHGLKPVHSLEEMLLLHQRFPDNIRLFAAYAAGVMLGGAVVFENRQVAHTQYLASSPEGRDLGAVDLVISELITRVYAHKVWFSFGVSTESNGTYLNNGLVEYKEGFGARTVLHDFYTLQID